MVDVIGRAVVDVTSRLNVNDFERSGSRLGGVLRKGALVGVAALGALAAEGVKSTLAFEEAESVSRKLANTLNNMGKSNAAAKQVENLASALQRKTGVDDEVIKKGQTILATFSQIAKSAGVTGGSFDRATRASLDLAASGFGSVDSAAKALGKALQDPEKGISALNRAGVTFTPTQKEMIKNFVKTGDVAAAQNLILKEVEKQVGGNAEAGAKASDKLKASFGELEESVGNVLTTLSGGKITNLSDAIFDLADALNSFADSDGLHDFVSYIDGVLSRTKMIVTETRKELASLNGADQPKPAGQDDGGVKAFLDNVFKSRDGAAILGNAVDGLKLKFTTLGDTMNTAISNAVGTVTGKFNELSTNIGTALLNAGNTVRTKTHEIANNLGNGLTGGINRLLSAIGSVPGKIRSKAGEWASAGAALITSFVSGMKSKVGSFASNIAAAVKTAINDLLPNSITLGGKFGVPSITLDIPQLATGVRDFAGGLALVGERGPELVNIPRGSDVYTNQESRAMSAGGGDVTIVNNYMGPTIGSQRKRENEWSLRYGARFGVQTGAAV